MSQPILYLARAAAALSGLTDVQMYPPGKQTITPSNADPKKKPVPLELLINEETAAVLESARATYQAKADAGEGDAPYFDFNHADGEASAWPKRIYWAGEDPILGGVRAECEPSSSGEAAVAGKLFRRFSPAFYQDKGKITGAPANMGGLVNRAAFTKIAPLFAKDGSEEEISQSKIDNHQSSIPTMTPEEIAALQEENKTLKESHAALQTKVDEMVVTAKAAAETDAKNFVATAAKEGRIAPGEAIQAKWVATIVADPSAKELILAMAPNPALKQIVHAKAAPDGEPEPVQAKSGIESLAEIIKAKRA